MGLQTHGVRKYPPTSALLASSAGLGWSTISAELRSHGASEAPAIVPQHVEICLVVAGNKDGLVRRTGAGFCQEAMPKTGAIWLSPAGVGKEIVITAPIPQTMHLYITLVDLAGVAGYSPFHFARKFTLAMGISPHRYISRIRLENAMAELAAGELPLAEIALNAPVTSPPARETIHRQVAGAACAFGTAKRSRQTRALRSRRMLILR